MNRIKDLRAERRMTQQELAAYLGVVRTTLSNYENEVNQLDPQTIARLCEIFGVTADYLLGLSSQRTAQISDADAALVAAYHAAPESVRQGIDALLLPYKAQERINTAAG